MRVMPRSPTKKPVRISVFNHKGGVGKTTVTMNLAATLADSGKRVLLVDTDPQCNLTSYLIADDVVDDLLDKADTDAGQTLWSAMRPISEAVGPIKIIPALRTPTQNLFLLPGDVRLSEFENDLTEFWGQCLQRRAKGFRGMTALSDLVTEVATTLKVDYVFYDSGPNIGPLNRAILLDSDHFIAPVACDLFSLRALKTLGRTLSSWISEWETIADLAPKETSIFAGRPRFLGYVPGGFRVYRGGVAQQQSDFLSQIEREVHSQIVTLLRRLDPALAPGALNQFKLGELKYFGGLVHASQVEGRPLYAVSAGSQVQRDQARASLTDLASKVEARVAEASK